VSYYRINVNLTTKHKINTISNLNFPPETIQKLLNMDAISEIATPPLKFMPFWELRAQQLEPLGIITGINLLNSDNSELASKLGKTVEIVEQWKQDLIDDLIVEFKSATCGC